jgi:hypothetical protein
MGFERSDFDAAAKRLDIHLDFAKGSRFACPVCGAAGAPAYDSEDGILAVGDEQNPAAHEIDEQAHIIVAAPR